MPEVKGSNNTNKLSPQEPINELTPSHVSSNNTNKLSPQEQKLSTLKKTRCSNNTNKLSPQEHATTHIIKSDVQIIQINLVLKNTSLGRHRDF